MIVSLINDAVLFCFYFLNFVNSVTQTNLFINVYKIKHATRVIATFKMPFSKKLCDLRLKYKQIYFNNYKDCPRRIWFVKIIYYRY